MSRRERRPPAAQSSEHRRRIAFEAARLMATLGLSDTRDAARRAARALGDSAAHDLPEHAEVLAQLREYQRLFKRDTQPSALRRRREAALEALSFLSGWDAVLVGPVLDGSADAHSPVALQVFDDDPDAFARFLADQGWPAEPASLSLRVRRDRSDTFTAWRFVADGVPFEVVSLPRSLQRQAPLGPDGRPMARAGIAALRALLAEDASDAG
jgi:hypothetical protein